MLKVRLVCPCGGKMRVDYQDTPNSYSRDKIYDRIDAWQLAHGRCLDRQGQWVRLENEV